MSRRCVDFAPPSSKRDDGLAILSEVDPVPEPERQPRLAHPGADALVIAEVAKLEPEHTCLNPGSDRYVESAEPVPKRIPAVTGQVLSNGQHDSASLKVIIFDNKRRSESDHRQCLRR
jgi:hypothetical protein